MMFGSGRVYRYAHCAACASLRYIGPPISGEEQYPSGYYVHAPRPQGTRPLAAWLQGRRARHAAGSRELLGGIVHHLFTDRAFDSLRRLKLQASSAILDVGCGNGRLVAALHRAGFRNVTGADPFLARVASENAQPRFLRSDIAEIHGQFDVVMFHHSFEHLPDPRATLSHVERLLRPGGQCLIATPNLDSQAWRDYGAEWVQIDAPRHYFIFSARALGALVADTGFVIEHIRHDSTAFQFWGSELYRRGIPLTAPASPARSRMPERLRPQMLPLSFKAALLNRRNDGDQLVMYLRKI
ncbi:MAG: class I SAM-dependent methyltransferase [Ignavibacteria bacterium]|nr:class I SAM-dependent methyltransferase [Ignavibacteria bacterium]